MDEERFFGPVEAPSLKDVRDAMEKIKLVVSPILADKREEEPDPVPESASDAGNTARSAPERAETNGPVLLQAVTVTEAGGATWDYAESLARSGQIAAALNCMMQLAASEHGRTRFLHKLALAEICLSSNRGPLAIMILEELDEQIKTLNLAAWESPELIARVWGQLYRQYLRSDDRKSRAQEVYLRLCRLDPWQALRWSAE